MGQATIVLHKGKSHSICYYAHQHLLLSCYHCYINPNQKLPTALRTRQTVRNGHDRQRNETTTRVTHNTEQAANRANRRKPTTDGNKTTLQASEPHKTRSTLQIQEMLKDQHKTTAEPKEEGTPKDERREGRLGLRTRVRVDSKEA